MTMNISFHFLRILLNLTSIKKNVIKFSKNILIILALMPVTLQNPIEGTPLHKLLRDPYILIACGEFVWELNILCLHLVVIAHWQIRLNENKNVKTTNPNEIRGEGVAGIKFSSNENKNELNDIEQKRIAL